MNCLEKTRAKLRKLSICIGLLLGTIYLWHVMPWWLAIVVGGLLVGWCLVIVVATVLG